MKNKEQKQTGQFLMEKQVLLKKSNHQIFNGTIFFMDSLEK